MPPSDFLPSMQVIDGISVNVSDLQIIDPESPRSPNAMLVDPQDIVIGQDDGALEDDQDHVAIINPDTLSSDSTLGSDTELTDAPPIFRADDCKTCPLATSLHKRIC